MMYGMRRKRDCLVAASGKRTSWPCPSIKGFKSRWKTKPGRQRRLNISQEVSSGGMLLSGVDAAEPQPSPPLVSRRSGITSAVVYPNPSNQCNFATDVILPCHVLDFPGIQEGILMQTPPSFRIGGQTRLTHDM
jgi:hypothetical protein